ncbi:insulin receptor-related protein [Folsomia candida]|uniref:insulin receptor-related protein n=1 Tax=Folsomia candida TaxID=158441 RepID=UPI001604DD27|nr:insulin receptor-related protein [Folsomia candida]
MLSNIRVVESLIYLHLILHPAVCIMCSVENNAFQDNGKNKTIIIKYSIIVFLTILILGNTCTLLIWRRSERFVLLYQVFFFTIPSIFWALLHYKVWWEQIIPKKLGLTPGLNFCFGITSFNLGVLLKIYYDLIRTRVGYPPTSRTIGVHVMKLITWHFWVTYGYAMIALSHIFIAQFTQVGVKFYDFLPFTVPRVASEVARMFLAFMFHRSYKNKCPKLLTRFVCITYVNDLTGKAFELVSDYKRQVILSKPAGISDKPGMTFPIQIFMFIFCYRLWFIYINYFKRRNESLEIDHFHRNFEKFVDEEEIRVVKVKCDQYDDNYLGEGFFGKVYKADMILPKSEIVAIKFITDFKSMLKDATALQKELQVLTLLSSSSSHENKNLVGFHGIAWHYSNYSYQIGIVLQYCARGTVKGYLDDIRNDYSFPGNVTSETLEALEKWGRQVVDAMKFLESRNIIHGDLSARNVLLDGQENAKLSDFGMSLKLYQYEEYTHPEQSVFPWRNMAIEVLRDLKFSIKSDVWSFGVLLWEFYTFGETPWAEVEWNGNFVNLLMDGYALKQLKYGGKIYTEVMLPCWNIDAGRRPSFTKLEKLLCHRSEEERYIIS